MQRKMNPKSLIKLAFMYGGSVMHRNNGSRILYYHDVYRSVNYQALDADLQMGTHLELFKKHIDVICKEGFDIVDRISCPEGQVAIMFDDGFRGIWECRDFFYEHQIHPTIFLPVEYIGQTEKGILSVKEILELQQHGFSFQSHGWSHRPLTSVPSNELYRELTESRIYLRNLLGCEVSGLCMPLGYYNPTLLDRIREAGYKDIYSCIPGAANVLPLGMNTRNLCQYASPLELKLILRGGGDMLAGRYLKLHCKL
jgi:putative polysaccharide deacetylase